MYMYEHLSTNQTLGSTVFYKESNVMASNPVICDKFVRSGMMLYCTHFILMGKHSCTDCHCNISVLHIAIIQGIQGRWAFNG